MKNKFSRILICLIIIEIINFRLKKFKIKKGEKLSHFQAFGWPIHFKSNTANNIPIPKRII